MDNPPQGRLGHRLNTGTLTCQRQDGCDGLLINSGVVSSILENEIQDKWVYEPFSLVDRCFISRNQGR